MVFPHLVVALLDCVWFLFVGLGCCGLVLVLLLVSLVL